jgi:hypothetical protein
LLALFSGARFSAEQNRFVLAVFMRGSLQCTTSRHPAALHDFHGEIGILKIRRL